MFAPETVGAQEKALLKRPGPSQLAGCEQFRRAASGPALRHSVGAACLFPRPAGRGSTSSWGLRASGGPQALHRTLWTGWMRLALRGQQRQHPWTHRLQGWPQSTLRSPRSVGFFQEDLTQNDPHWGISLNGQTQCFQGSKGRVYLTFCHTLVEGAYLKVAIRAPRITKSG